MTELVRRWTHDDLPSVREVLRRTWDDAYSPFIPVEDLHQYLDQVYTIDMLKKMTDNPDMAGFVGVQDGRIVAVLRMRTDRSESRCYVSSVYVIPEEQGHGWGRRLMRQAAERAVDLGKSELWLGVMSQNVLAQEWYKKNGFVAVREEPFTMGRTTVAHLIGCLPVTSFLASPPAKAGSTAPGGSGK